jgi:hypothetical protein
MITLRSAHARSLLFLPLLALGVTGCEDAVGFGRNCSGQMQEIRRAEGPPISTQGPSGRDGDFTELWRYPTHVYTFRWGVSYPTGCEVTGPSPLNAELPI